MRRIIISLLISLAILTPASGLGRTNKNMPIKIANVLLPNRSPLVTFRLQFMSGAAADPKGKEGVAALTAAMLAQGGSRTMTYEQIVKAMYPMATSFGWQIDKEMTVFTGTTHVDNLDTYYGLISQMLLDPGFRADARAGRRGARAGSGRAASGAAAAAARRRRRPRRRRAAAVCGRAESPRPSPARRRSRTRCHRRRVCSCAHPGEETVLGSHVERLGVHQSHARLVGQTHCALRPDPA